MVKCCFEQAELSGTVQLPMSKSLSHRRLIASFLSGEPRLLRDMLICDDIQATLNVFFGIGGHYQWQKNGLWVDGRELFTQKAECFEVFASATSLRMLIPVCLLRAGQYTFHLADRLASRSIIPYIKALPNVTFRQNQAYLSVSGSLDQETYLLDASESSQFVSGLLWALPLLEHDTTLILENKPVSSAYLAMTEKVLKQSGIQWEKQGLIYSIRGGQRYCFQDDFKAYDASSAAFFEVARYLGQPIKIPHFDGRYQADHVVKRILQAARQHPLTIDAADMPDAVPALALALALSKHHYTIIHAKRLQDKESPRLTSVAESLNAMGACIQVTPDGLFIQGRNKLHGAHLKSYHDHRIAMMIAIAASVAEGQTILEDAQCITKSWPNFYQEYRRLGGKMCELSIR